MADTRPDIQIPADTPVDIYAALNAQVGYPAVTIGTRIRVQNKGNNELELHAGADDPVSADGSTRLPRLGFLTNDTGDLGAWVTSKVVDSVINVRVV